MLLRRSLLVAGSLLVVGSVAAQVDLDSLKKLAKPDAGSSQASSGSGSLLSELGGGSLPTLSGDNASNAAGVVTYCAKNNYLNANAASTLKDKLLAKAGLQPAEAEQDPGYKSGLQGLLTSSDGKTTDINGMASNLKGKVKDKATKKACSYVLDNAGKLI